MNTEFQRIARRDKKAFLSDQCKEIEENNRIGKTRDLFKKIRATKGTFHAKKVIQVPWRSYRTFYEIYFPGGSEVKASASNAEDPGSIPGSGRSPGEGNGNPLQYSCLENPMDGEA